MLTSDTRSPRVTVNLRCKHNLISLGRWENTGRSYHAQDGVLTLYTQNNHAVIQGEQTSNNLYWLKLHVLHDNIQSTENFSFTTTQSSWDTWHWRFGHISYGGLKTLQDKKLVSGFFPDRTFPKPDCIACTQAKLTHKPFPSTATRTKGIGNLTHMDLWGKYEIHSIHGNQYYILLIDDYSRYVTVQFLKSKNQATQHICDYMTHLSVRNFAPQAIRVDRGSEFLNKDLLNWCKERGIDIEPTAPYSPSQNGVAERMNRTLVELAHGMISVRQLPEFLWEPAVAHAAYLRNNHSPVL